MTDDSSKRRHVVTLSDSDDDDEMPSAKKTKGTKRKLEDEDDEGERKGKEAKTVASTHEHGVLDRRILSIGKSYPFMSCLNKPETAEIFERAHFHVTNVQVPEVRRRGTTTAEQKRVRGPLYTADPAAVDLLVLEWPSEAVFQYDSRPFADYDRSGNEIDAAERKWVAYILEFFASPGDGDFQNVLGAGDHFWYLRLLLTGRVPSDRVIINCLTEGEIKTDAKDVKAYNDFIADRKLQINRHWITPLAGVLVNKWNRDYDETRIALGRELQEINQDNAGAGAFSEDKLAAIMAALAVQGHLKTVTDDLGSLVSHTVGSAEDLVVGGKFKFLGVNEHGTKRWSYELDDNEMDTFADDVPEEERGVVLEPEHGGKSVVFVPGEETKIAKPSRKRKTTFVVTEPFLKRVKRWYQTARELPTEDEFDGKRAVIEAFDVKGPRAKIAYKSVMFLKAKLSQDFSNPIINVLASKGVHLGIIDSPGRDFWAADRLLRGGDTRIGVYAKDDVPATAPLQGYADVSSISHRQATRVAYTASGRAVDLTIVSLESQAGDWTGKDDPRLAEMDALIDWFLDPETKWIEPEHLRDVSLANVILHGVRTGRLPRQSFLFIMYKSDIDDDLLREADVMDRQTYMTSDGLTEYLVKRWVADYNEAAVRISQELSKHRGAGTQFDPDAISGIIADFAVEGKKKQVEYDSQYAFVHGHKCSSADVEGKKRKHAGAGGKEAKEENKGEGDRWFDSDDDDNEPAKKKLKRKAPVFEKKHSSFEIVVVDESKNKKPTGVSLRNKIDVERVLGNYVIRLDPRTIQLQNDVNLMRRILRANLVLVPVRLGNDVEFTDEENHNFQSATLFALDDGNEDFSELLGDRESIEFTLLDWIHWLRHTPEQFVTRAGGKVSSDFNVLSYARHVVAHRPTAVWTDNGRALGIGVNDLQDSLPLEEIAQAVADHYALPAARGPVGRFGAGGKTAGRAQRRKERAALLKRQVDHEREMERLAHLDDREFDAALAQVNVGARTRPGGAGSAAAGEHKVTLSDTDESDEDEMMRAAAAEIADQRDSDAMESLPSRLAALPLDDAADDTIDALERKLVIQETRRKREREEQRMADAAAARAAEQEAYEAKIAAEIKENETADRSRRFTRAVDAWAPTYRDFAAREESAKRRRLEAAMTPAEAAREERSQQMRDIAGIKRFRVLVVIPDNYAGPSIPPRPEIEWVIRTRSVTESTLEWYKESISLRGIDLVVTVSPGRAVLPWLNDNRVIAHWVYNNGFIATLGKHGVRWLDWFSWLQFLQSKHFPAWLEVNNLPMPPLPPIINVLPEKIDWKVICDDIVERYQKPWLLAKTSADSKESKALDMVLQGTHSFKPTSEGAETTKPVKVPHYIPHDLRGEMLKFMINGKKKQLHMPHGSSTTLLVRGKHSLYRIKQKKLCA